MKLRKLKLTVLVLASFGLCIAGRFVYVQYHLRSTQHFRHQIAVSKPKLLVVHGILASGRFWNGWTKHFEGNFDVIIPDLLGFGESHRNAPNYSYETQVAGLKSYIDAQWGEDAQFLAIGHSMGAQILAEWQHREPRRFLQTVLISAPDFKSVDEMEKSFRKQSGVMGALITSPRFSRAVCTLHEMFGSWMIPLFKVFNSGLNTEVLEDSIKHSWSSFSQSVAQIVMKYPISKSLSEMSKTQRVHSLLLYGDIETHVNFSELKSQFESSKLKFEQFPGDHNFVLAPSPELVDRVDRFLK